MDWQQIIQIAVEPAGHYLMSLVGVSWILVLIAVVNWSLGGIGVAGRTLKWRRSRLFIGMRWLGFFMWLGTILVVIPSVPPLDPIPVWGATTHIAGAVMMLLGTARKFEKRRIETPSSVKSLFGDE